MWWTMVVWWHGRNRHIFLRGQSHFSWFFPVENSHFGHFGTPKTNFRRFQKWKAKKERKKKKKSSPLFINFPTFILNFPSSLLQFCFFSSQLSPLFPFILAFFFPIRKQKFPGQKSLGGTLPPCPPPRLLRHCLVDTKCNEHWQGHL